MSTRRPGDYGEMYAVQPFGNKLAATEAPDRGDAVVAFMNPGGIRTDLLYPSSPAGEGDGNVTYILRAQTQPASRRWET